jgi:CRP-like cAMP-binding protein
MKILRDYFDSVSRLNEETWSFLLPLFKPEILSSGSYFVKENEVARKVAFLEAGVVRAFFVNREGKEYNKQFFVGPSSIGGYTSLLSGKVNIIAQQALTECKVWVIDYKEITGNYDRYRDLERLARRLAEHYFLEKEKKELEIVLLDATERYAVFQQEFPGLEQTIPQYHIASYLGVTPTQLSRIRAQLVRKK